MPSKQAPGARTRTHSREQQQRVWGSRFDSLKTPSPTASPASSGTSAQLAQAHALSLELFGANAKPTEKRDWADDDVPLTTFTPSRGPLVLDLSGGSTPGRRDIAKLPHDASVFIGSLPPGTDEVEMARLLAQHLAQFVKVQNIKIVHDSKGGLCAFAQCENAVQAVQLVSQAQADPQPFLGRYLRYENARAHRSLWVSYRTPFHFMPCASQDEEGADVVVDDNGVKGRWIESDLPDALRIWKPRDARYPIVTFRGEARNNGDASRCDKHSSSTDVAPAFRHKGVLFTELKFDAQTIRKMAEAFGPIESFKVYSTGQAFTSDTDPYPLEHNLERSSGMDLRVWEIKWGHRDNCITAFNTLRRIPHLMVTWAKDAGNPQTPRAGILRIPTSPRHSVSHSPREAASPVPRGRPFLLLDCASENDGGFRSAESPVSASAPAFTHSTNSHFPQEGSTRVVPSRTVHKNESVQRVYREDDDGWTVVRPQNITRVVMSSFAGDTPENPVATEHCEKEAPEWNEGDFPPLVMQRDVCIDAEKVFKDKKEPPSSTTVTTVDDVNFSSPPHEQKDAVTSAEPSDTPDSSRRPIVHRRSLSNPAARSPGDEPRSITEGPRVEIPPTPELADTSLTLSPTSAHPGPETPMYPTIVPLASADCSAQYKESEGHEEDLTRGHEEECVSSESGRRHEHEQQRQLTIDPNTIFVGGLEPFGPRSWDEARLRQIFEKYGKVQDVRVVIPTTKKTGFAFVTFEDEQSTRKAMREEHNRVYDGRQIRVQMRDMFPSRGGFKFRGRGLGRRPFGHHDPQAFDRQQAIGEAGEHRPFMPLKSHQTFGAYPRNAQGNVPFTEGGHFSQRIVSSTSSETNTSTLHSSTSFANPEVNTLQGLDSKTAASVTPPLSTTNASVHMPLATGSATPQAISQTQVGYYSPHTWSSPYGAPMQYPMPFSVYGGVIQPVPMHVTSTNQAPNTSTGAVGSTPMHWSSMYRTGVPFAPYPYMIVPTMYPEAPRSVTTSSQPSTPVKDQPPLHATGFIRGEQGMLIPIYPPEALDQYMSGSSPAHSPTRTRTSTTSSGISSVEQQHQQSFMSPQFWPGFPPASQFVAYPASSAAGMSSSVTVPGSVHPQTIQQQIHGQHMQSPGSGAGPYVPHSVGPGGGHAIPARQQATSGPTAAPIPPHYITRNHPGVNVVSPFSGHGMHGATPGRGRTYGNRHPPRRDPAFHGRNGHGQGHEPMSKFVGTCSPSSTHPISGPPSTPRAEQHPNHLPSQHQQHAHTPGAHHQVGYNKHTPDGGGHLQQHQWNGRF